ncbi:MAG: alpha/beta hydrolase [Candidatus Poribacteria bacterium]|nr:alpha/beta hydrolase [Candidatus Poribacteria bacterium]
MFTEIDNLKIAYQVEGTGTPVVLLHGWGGEANSFRPVFDSLSRFYRVYALDLPGFGLSEIPPTAWDASDYAKFLSAFFHKLNINKAHLIGHSYGGRISIVMAAEEPEKIDKLILVDSAGIIPPRTAKYYIQISLAKVGRLMRYCGAPGNRLADNIAQRVGSKDYREAGPMRATMVKSVNQNLRPLLPKIQASTLLIWGENDTDTPISFGRIMEKEIPDARLIVLKDAGHFSYLDQLPQFCETVTDFLV